jgi:hypothetical protein
LARFTIEKRLTWRADPVEDADVTKTEEMIERATRIEVPADEVERQRRSFAYGNAKTENDRVTRKMVDEAAEKHPRNG